jgi:hypothetical protein
MEDLQVRPGLGIEELPGKADFEDAAICPNLGDIVNGDPLFFRSARRPSGTAKIGINARLMEHRAESEVEGAVKAACLAGVGIKNGMVSIEHVFAGAVLFVVVVRVDVEIYIVVVVESADPARPIG